MQSPRGEDMTNPSDWLYQWNKTYNLLAAGAILFQRSIVDMIHMA